MRQCPVVQITVFSIPSDPLLGVGEMKDRHSLKFIFREALTVSRREEPLDHLPWIGWSTSTPSTSLHPIVSVLDLRAKILVMKKYSVQTTSDWKH